MSGPHQFAEGVQQITGAALAVALDSVAAVDQSVDAAVTALRMAR